MPFEMFKQFLTSGSDYFGKKPDVPKFPSSKEIIGESLAANEANRAGAEQLASRSNAFNFAQLQKLLQTTFPDLAGVNQSISGNIAAMARGQIPQGVSDVVTSSAAAKALAGGYGGSGLHANLVARDLGLTSLQLTDKALDSASRWLQASRAFQMPEMLPVQASFLTPMQQFAVSEAQWNANWLANKVDASPDPVARGRADQEMALFATIMSAVGGMGGGGGGSVQWQQPNYGNPGGGGGGGGGWSLGGGGYLSPGVYGSPGIDVNINNFPTSAPNPNRLPPPTPATEGGGLWA